MSEKNIDFTDDNLYSLEQIFQPYEQDDDQDNWIASLSCSNKNGHHNGVIEIYAFT